jgi:hypothetical protein
MAAELTVTGDVPVDVNVNDFVAEEFTVTLPKLNEVALNDNCGVVAAAPVPLRDTVVVLPLAELLLMVRLPAADPVAVGANFTCSVRVCLGLNVAGRVPPTREKPVPETDAELTVTGAVPDDVSVNDCVPEEFTVTLPKLNEPALALICGVAATAPVPNVTICMTQGPEEANVALALLLPAVVTILSSAISPSGVVITRDVKPLPAAFVAVATVLAPKINSLGLLVVAAPLFALVLLPLAPAVTSTAVTPRYSRMRTSGYAAAWLNVTVTVLLLTPAMFAA